VLERDPGDPHYLGGDGDGVPCEDLPTGNSASSEEGSPSVPATAPSTAAGAPPSPSAVETLSLLRRLRVAPPGSMAGYSRDEFPHWASDAASYGWSEPDGSCDVRDAALIRDGRGVRIDAECDMTAGTWLDPYTGRTLSDSSEVDIDHVVPLANAWRSGASSAAWSAADREAYADDPEVLLSTDAGANRTKGDKGPEAWKPPNRDYWCEYSRRWIWITSDWRLSVNPAVKTASPARCEHLSEGGLGWSRVRSAFALNLRFHHGRRDDRRSRGHHWRPRVADQRNAEQRLRGVGALRWSKRPLCRLGKSRARSFALGAS
jgi:hypothetical protein